LSLSTWRFWSLLKPSANDSAPLSAKCVLLKKRFKEYRCTKRLRMSPIALACPASEKFPEISHSRYIMYSQKFLKNYVCNLSMAASSSEKVLKISLILDPFSELFSFSVNSWRFCSCSLDFLMTTRIVVMLNLLGLLFARFIFWSRTARLLGMYFFNDTEMDCFF